MINFDPDQLVKSHQNGVDIIPKVIKMAEEIDKIGYDNIFLIGSGGTYLYGNVMATIAKHIGSTIPMFVEDAADFSLCGNPHFSKNSLVIYETISGDTKEMVKAIGIAKDTGAKIFGYAQNGNSPLAELTEYLISTTGGEYYFWYVSILKLLNLKGFFPQFDKFVAEFKTFPSLVVDIQKTMDVPSVEFADKHKDKPLHFIVGSGNLEAFATSYGMCIMEEMQWMKSRPISASNFFHGTLEIVERDSNVILIKGEDATRPLVDRVENFVNKICENVTVFDTKMFELPGISEEFRGMLAPFVCRCAFQRLSANLEHQRRHPLAIRRYYRRLDY